MGKVPPVMATTLVNMLFWALMFDNVRVWNKPEDLIFNIVVQVLLVLVLIVFSICTDFKK